MSQYTGGVYRRIIQEDVQEGYTGGVYKVYRMDVLRMQVKPQEDRGMMRRRGKL
jgi:hypothetical protein